VQLPRKKLWMHSIKGVAGTLGSHALPGVILLFLSVAMLCAWEVLHLTGGQISSGRHHLASRLIPRLIGLTGVVLGAASCVLISARFIWVA
jgi:hypothetical protein